jgi:alpha-L-fucosidase
MYQRKFFILCLFSLAFSFSAVGEIDRETKYEPSLSNIEARESFQDAKFGIFIHWGIYSLMAGAGDEGIAEWVMENKQIPINKYEKLASYFNPVAFDADEWVKTFKSAGAQYITITTKHHDGFAMYDSKVSDYNIVDKTPFGRDIMKELKAACDKHGLKLFFYYSQLDWHHPDYYPRGRTGHNYTGRPANGDWNKYLDFQNAQLEELLTNYGDIGGFWFDGWWDQEKTAYHDKWALSETYQLIHKIQPHALIINNHHVTPFPGEDVQPFEQDLPGENTAGFNTNVVSKSLPLEMAQTMNGSWGFNLIDDGFKSTKDLIQQLVGSAGRNANFLLNTGPMPDGRLQPENIQTYKEMGEWLNTYGESIYGTRGGPITPRTWGVTTQKADKVYVHVLDWKEQQLLLPPTDFVINDARLLKNGKSVKFKNDKKGALIIIPKPELNEWDAVIELSVRSQ